MKILDLFCGAGGAAMGYHRAGFDEIVGVDNRPMPRYPFTFVLGDALEYVREHGHEFDAVHASPPCQAYSRCRKILEGKGLPNRRAVDLIGLVRCELQGLVFILENVPGAPMREPLVLCGTMFGLGVYRHRLFEVSPFVVLSPPHPTHRFRTGSHRGYSSGSIITVSGHNYRPIDGRRAMDVDWMTRDELNEAIPPAYTEFIGLQLLQFIRNGRKP